MPTILFSPGVQDERPESVCTSVRRAGSVFLLNLPQSPPRAQYHSTMYPVPNTTVLSTHYLVREYPVQQYPVPCTQYQRTQQCPVPSTTVPHTGHLPQSPPRALSVIERLSARRALSNVYSRTDWQTSWAFWDRLWPQSTMVSPQLSHVPEFNLSQNWKYLLHSYVCVAHCVHSCKGIIHRLHVSNIMSEKAEPRWSIFAKEFCNAQFYQTGKQAGRWMGGWVS